MKNKELIRPLKFFLFSISAGIIQIVSFALFEEVFHFAHWLSYLIALVLSVVWNFTFNRKFTFKSKANLTKSMILVALYYCVFTPLSTGLEHYLAGVILMNAYLVTFINMVLNFITEFLFQRYVVYRNNVDTIGEKQ